jgi:FMN-dependent oxidoreductase (nitrilotriacetate monooxygenase family)
MSGSRQLRLGAFMRPVSLHTGAWRYPGAFPDANFNFAHLKRFAQTLERGRFDAFFMADHLAVLNMPMDALKRSATVTSFDPLTLLPALAVVTEHLGLIATASTTFDQPYHLARKFASLDHISGGRAGWNLVTTSNPDAALNFGLEEHMEHGERYRRAREFFDVVTGLWDSWADDAFIRDVDTGIYFDPEKLHVLNHKGQYLSVRGPLNIARPIQGWPVVVQAGSSEDGRQIAAETAEVIFSAPASLAEGQRFYADVRAAWRRWAATPTI